MPFQLEALTWEGERVHVSEVADEVVYSDATRIEFAHCLGAALEISAAVGAHPLLSVWIQGSFDRETWFDVPCDRTWPVVESGAPTAQASENQPLIGAAALGTAGKWAAIWRDFPFDWARVASFAADIPDPGDGFTYTTTIGGK